MLIRLTGIGHPDIDGGAPQAIYVDPSRVLVIERGWIQHTKESSAERYRQALSSLHQEVRRVAGEVDAMPRTVVPEDEAEARNVDRWMHAKDASYALSAAYGLVSQYANAPEQHPRQPCTTVSLACGTGLEHGVMLKMVHVTETQEQVAEMMNWQDERAAMRGLPE